MQEQPYRSYPWAAQSALAEKAGKLSTKEAQKKSQRLRNASEQVAACNHLSEILTAHSWYQEKPIKQAFYNTRVMRA